MKKLFFLAALLLLTGITFGQGLSKGNLIGVHVMTVTLQPGITMKQVEDFYVNTYIPEVEKLMSGVKIYLVKGIRGENKNNTGVIMVFKSEQIRDKYNNDDGSPTDLSKSIMEKLKPMTEKLNNLGRVTTTYTDWIVQ